MKASRSLLLLLACLVVPACEGGSGDDGSLPVSEIAVVTLSSNVLTTYAARAPGVPLATLTVTGISGNLIGIDYRPVNGELLAASDAEQLYVINPTTGAAAARGGAFPVALNGTAFAFDVNPQTDQLRIASNLGQNMRVTAGTGAVVDTDPDTAGTQIDGTLVYDATDSVGGGQTPDVVAFAHANNFPGTPSAPLYGIDRNLDRLIQATNPNTGLLRTVGALGVTVTDASFDIAADNQGYLGMARQSDGLTRLYSVNLANGAAVDRGQLGAGAAIQGLAVAALPPFQPASGSLVVLKPGNVLLNYASGAPNLIAGALVVTGVTGSLVGIDYRPSNGKLLGVSDADRLYEIHPVTGAATSISAAPFGTPLAGTDFGVLVDGAEDRVRIVSEADENQRVDPATGATASADTALAYDALDANNGANPQVVAIAIGGAGPSVYGIDVGLDVLVTLDPADGGVLNTVGALGVDATTASFDVSGGGIAYAALTVGGTTSLYSINLGTGAAALLGTLGSGGPVVGLAVKP